MFEDVYFTVIAVGFAERHIWRRARENRFCDDDMEKHIQRRDGYIEEIGLLSRIESGAFKGKSREDERDGLEGRVGTASSYG